ncbi:hypothetical protein Tco_0761012 [Tanacetum coccineum]
MLRSPEEYPLAHRMIHEDLLPELDCLTKVEMVHEHQDAEMSLHQIVPLEHWLTMVLFQIVFSWTPGLI